MSAARRSRCTTRWPRYARRKSLSGPRRRLGGERNTTGEQRGFGRLSGDFWAVEEAQGRDGAISSRYPNSSNGQLQIRMDPYLWPGPDGAISTVRLEMMREGLMECEARITVEAALLDETARARLGEERARAYEAMLDERTRWLRRAGDVAGEQTFIESGWRDRNARLFAAAEVNRLLARLPSAEGARGPQRQVPTAEGHARLREGGLTPGESALQCFCPIAGVPPTRGML